MDVQNMMMRDSSNIMAVGDDANTLPGYRFHPTDEELVRFYLRRKVENKPIRLDLIKHIDIYKYDPWDLPKASGSNGEKEWYFFCRRGKKYRNSVRPNRVTKSGFWKATGIDKPVYSVGDHDFNNNCIGLKKTLVYYRGSAGKGTKTDWMMHEFRLPATSEKSTIKNTTQEAEVWTLCRIVKRNNNNSFRKVVSSWHKEEALNKHPNQSVADSSSSNKTCSSSESDDANINKDEYHMHEGSQIFPSQLRLKEEVLIDPNSYLSFSNPNEEDDDMLRSSGGNWDELRPMVDCVLNPSMLYSIR